MAGWAIVVRMDTSPEEFLHESTHRFIGCVVIYTTKMQGIARFSKSFSRSSLVRSYAPPRLLK
jgi:hypothetical protein